MYTQAKSYEVRIPLYADIVLNGNLFIPKKSEKMVIFVHGSGSSRLSPRNNLVAKKLQEKGMGTLLIDLLTQEEDSLYTNRFDINLLTNRVIAITQFLLQELQGQTYTYGYFGASTGAAAALRASIAMGPRIQAIVCKGGRPDLAQEALGAVRAPTLFIVGGDDTEVITLNRNAYQNLSCVKELKIIPGATHLFEEEGKLEEVAKEASTWFERYLAKL